MAIPSIPPSSDPVGKAIRTLDRHDRLDKNFLPNLRKKDDVLRRFIIESFNRDSLLATNMGATFNLTRLFAPMVQRREVRFDRAGSEALEIIVPHLRALPWEAVIEFREHPGSKEARAKLREFEEVAAREEPQDAERFRHRVSQEVSSATMSAWNDVRPKLPEELAQEAITIVVSLTQLIGEFTPLIPIAKAIRDSFRVRRSWPAALWQLRNHS